eukprot:1190320-Prorocentrum_minimum.AAC.7
MPDEYRWIGHFYSGFCCTKCNKLQQFAIRRSCGVPPRGVVSLKHDAQHKYEHKAQQKPE